MTSRSGFTVVKWTIICQILLVYLTKKTNSLEMVVFHHYCYILLEKISSNSVFVLKRTQAIKSFC